MLFSSSFHCRDGERSYWDNVSVYSKYIVCLCVRLLTHGVHVQRSPPRVGAVVLVVLTGWLSGRRRTGTPQAQLATTQYGLVERHQDTEKERES